MKIGSLVQIKESTRVHSPDVRGKIGTVISFPAPDKVLVRLDIGTVEWAKEDVEEVSE